MRYARFVADLDDIVQSVLVGCNASQSVFYSAFSILSSLVVYLLTNSRCLLLLASHTEAAQMALGVAQP